MALWWGVAQGAQLQNVQITMAYSSNGNGHTGIHLGRGSTLGLADVRIEKGQVCHFVILPLLGIWSC